jgi:hypothetical protein
MPPGGPEQPTTYGSLSPEAALKLVGHDLRAEILWTLSEARAVGGGPPALSFAALRERVVERRRDAKQRADRAGREFTGDVDVDSSKFNYHLQELVGHFVERRDDGAAESQLVEEMVDEHGPGYALRPEGTILTRTIRSLTFAGEASIEPFAVGLDCYYCGGDVEAAYDNGICKVQCPDCEYLYDYNLTPPGVVDDDREEVLSRVARYNRHVRFAFADGVCPYCANAVPAEVRTAAGTGYPRSDRREVIITRQCDHCGNMDNLTVGELLLRDPELVAFCHERGLDIANTPIWDLEFAATDRHVTVHSTDPWEVSLTVSLDGDTLELAVDESLTVVERERT